MSFNSQQPTREQVEFDIYLLNEEFYTTDMTKDEYLKKLFALQRLLLIVPSRPVTRS